jgi:hypothetical protein
MEYKLLDKKNKGAMLFIFIAIILNIGFQLFFIPNIDITLTTSVLILFIKYPIPIIILLIAFYRYKEHRMQTLLITIIICILETFDFLAVTAEFMNQFYNYVAAIMKDSFMLTTKTFHIFHVIFWGMLRIFVLAHLVKSFVILKKQSS